MSESFSTVPLQTQLNAYPYQEYAADPDIQAFFTAYNTISQSYLNWFNQTPLGVYTSPAITGPILDWVGEGLYNIKRPVLTTSSILRIAGYNAVPYNTLAYNALSYSQSGTATTASDDIYKRVLTWHTYRGDGQVFCIQWLKRRVARFLYGANGTDAPVLNTPPSVAVSGGAFTVTIPAGVNSTAFQQCVSNGILALPFQYNFTIAT